MNNKYGVPRWIYVGYGKWIRGYKRFMRTMAGWKARAKAEYYYDIKLRNWRIHKLIEKIQKNKKRKQLF